MNSKIYSLVSDLLEKPEVRARYGDTKHFFVKWDKHVKRTIILSYYLAKLVGANPFLTTRAAALHDIDDQPRFNHSKKCSIKAGKIENNPKVIEAIETHMFPLSKIPKSKEAWSLVIADKIINAVDLLDF